MESLNPDKMLAADAVAVAIKDENLIRKQRAAIYILGILCVYFAGRRHGKK